VFERYTERARRVIFFGRYEASSFGSDYIEPEHLLLAILREDKAVRTLLGDGGAENIQKKIEAFFGPPKFQASTAVDMPLSHPSKRILAYGAKEAELLGHHYIGVIHLALGLLRESESFAAKLLRKAEIDREKLQACHNTTPAAEPRMSLQLMWAMVEQEAQMLNQKPGPEHILLALLRSGDTLAAKILKEKGLTLEELRKEIRRRYTAEP
jgi:ATP-dependent Clp protease ATP-binding subunit ClpA